MGIADLFRPNWKHSNKRVRAAAVKAMDSTQAGTLSEVAGQDPDPEIRALALGRIEDPEILEGLAAQLPDKATAALARSRADSLWMLGATQAQDETRAEKALVRVAGSEALMEVVRRSSLPQIQRLALERLEDQRCLCEVVKSAKSREIALAALEKLSDVAILRGLVLEEPRKEIAQAALDRIEDAESLKLIAQRAKVKAIRTRARRQLDGAQEAAGSEGSTAIAQKKLHAQLAQLCREAEALANSTDWDGTAAHLAEAESRWNELAAGLDEPDAKLRERFDTACKGFGLRREHAVAARSQRQADLARRETEREGERADREKREGILARILELPADASDEALSALVSEWDSLGPPPETRQGELAKKLEAAIKRWSSKREAAASAEERSAAFEAVLAAAELSLQKDRLSEIQRDLQGHRRAIARLEKSFGKDPAISARFKAIEARFEELEANERLAREEERRRNLQRIERLASKAEGALQDGSLAQVDRLLKDVKDTLKKPGALPGKEEWNALRPRLETAREALATRLRELREQEDWKRWNAGSQQEKLVAEAEALKEVEALPEVASRLRRVQAEWKKSGPASRERQEELWTRFKAACDEAHARCEPFFQAQDAERQACLEQKLALCAEVETLKDSEEFVATTDRIKALQEQWKAIGPVPRKESDAIWRRFRTACDHFFDRRKAWQKQEDAKRGENLKAKEALCARAEELSSSTDWEATSNAMKALQSEWKAIGPVPRSKADAIWARFRGACDKFFEQRKEHLDEGRTGNLEKRRALLDELTRLLDLPPEGGSGEVAAKFVEAWDGWKALSPVPTSEDAPTRARFDALVLRAIEGHRAGFLGTMLDPMLTAQKMEGLCVKAEALAAEVASLRSSKQAGDIDPGDAEAMAAALKEALAASAFRKDFQQEDAARMYEQSSSLRRSFERLGPLPGEEGAALAARFEKAFSVLGTLKPPRD
ncbi:MAG: DUF349 domain-containing protein [Polyangia bacterium]|jgi:hypothetical protein|nr:DUF349 domain-containing protein [Polyangia bacterium]